MDFTEKLEKTTALSQVFRPRVPVTSKELFSGRMDQMQEIITTCLQPGQHGIVFGERGVGKTSLVNVTYQILGEQINRPGCGPINCDTTTDFSSMWHKAFRECPVTDGKTLDTLLPKVVTPDDIRHVVQNISKTVFVFDEIDQIKDRKWSASMAATIKNLSDHGLDTTIILVGVADSVDSLLAEHGSVERALVQIPMPRMSEPEIRSIIDTGMQKVRMTMSDEVRNRIASLSHGLPHVTHLLSLHAGESAVDNGRLNVTIDDLRMSIKRSLKQAQQSVISAYDKAVSSAIKNAQYRQVLTACALANTDSSGFFYAGDVREPMSKIMEKSYDIPAFSPHISAFCEAERGPILKRQGTPKNYRFRFINPLMQPYVIMRALDTALISDETAFK